MVRANPLQTPSATVPTGAGMVPNPAWEVLVNQAHENAHNTLQAHRDKMHGAGKVGYVDTSGQRPGQSTSDQEAFVSVPRPPDTQSF